MNMKRKLVGAMFAIVGGAALLMGCPETTDQSCTFDSDCEFEGDICIDQTCVMPCDTDEDCSFDDECVERASGGASYCQPPASQGCTDHGDCASDELCNFETNVCEGEAPACTDNSDCNEAAGEFCDEIEQVCVNPQQGDDYYTVRVHDVTTERCGDQTYGFETNGSKLMYVALMEDNQYIAWGDAIDFNLGFSDGGENPNFGYPNEIINGTPPSFDDRCPAITESQSCLAGSSCNGDTVTTNFREDSVAAIGCDGEVYIQFRDSDGNLLTIDDGMEIEVNEYGTFCAEESEAGAGNHKPQSGEDAYDVYICTDGSSSDIDINTCAKINTAAAYGLASFPVSIE